MNSYTFLFRTVPPHPDKSRNITVKDFDLGSACDHDHVKTFLSLSKWNCRGIVVDNGSRLTIYQHTGFIDLNPKEDDE